MQLCLTETCLNRMGEIRNKFLIRGYQEKLVDRHVEKVRNMDRKDLLVRKNRDAQRQERIPLVTAYNDSSKYVAQIIRKNWKVLL